LISSSNIVIKGKDGKVVESGLAGTGMTITIGNSTYTLVVKGDTSGDRKLLNSRLITSKTSLYRKRR